ncbi:MAG: DUF2076 domain-containing protein [Pseudomonadota bacterium]|nr:DUF2076 domain-containing protein [Pseudomonadota bacterium]
MDYQDRQAIESLFAKLNEVERQSGPRDAEAEAFIRSRAAAQPGAPYYMAQTIVMQEQALYAAQARIADLEHQLASRPAGGGGFLSSLFGGGQPQPAPRPQPMPGMPPHMAPGMNQMAPGRGGGFLAGAAQTAMGVAGGMLLGNMLADAFGGDDAKGGEAGGAEPQQAAAEDIGDSGDDFGFDEA